MIATVHEHFIQIRRRDGAILGRIAGTLVDALFPVMGPAIRKAISEALSGMVQSMNRTLEHSISVQGLKWRDRDCRHKMDNCTA